MTTYNNNTITNKSAFTAKLNEMCGFCSFLQGTVTADRSLDFIFFTFDDKNKKNNFLSKPDFRNSSTSFLFL